ncbi:hypothetical protein CAEBREN_08059 [Caenorhabditis brenneri]|uniref:Uncharacterized protein n=1 Tax=Caenorhabditis brenneri TaxID=135651 RepID=G0PBY4_CAEBE|nr:hypothetical protein CAEBREN_08059 [Caenorhabditis brenneri]
MRAVQEKKGNFQHAWDHQTHGTTKLSWDH